jgi:hypothetical protein
MSSDEVYRVAEWWLEKHGDSLVREARLTLEEAGEFRIANALLGDESTSITRKSYIKTNNLRANEDAIANVLFKDMEKALQRALHDVLKYDFASWIIQQNCPESYPWDWFARCLAAQLGTVLAPEWKDRLSTTKRKLRVVWTIYMG